MTVIFETDADKCVGCGACVRDCAFKALRRDVSGRPILASPDKCMRCQHCLAVCPTGHPFAAMLFGVPGVRYPRGVARDGAARVIYR